MKIPIKNSFMIAGMQKAGALLAEVFDVVQSFIQSDISTLELNNRIEKELALRELVSGSKGFQGFCYATCISLNDEVVHGIPSSTRLCKPGDIVKVDVCASHKGFFADMARMFVIEPVPVYILDFVAVTRNALDTGIGKAIAGSRLSDISAAIEQEVRSHGYSVVRDFAGHGIGLSMHEEPEILNYGQAGRGPVLREGMAFAIEPMITMKNYKVYVAQDGWTVKTVDGSLAGHVEDTVLITENGPMIITRPYEVRVA